MRAQIRRAVYRFDLGPRESKWLPSKVLNGTSDAKYRTGTAYRVNPSP